MYYYNVVETRYGEQVTLPHTVESEVKLPLYEEGYREYGIWINAIERVRIAKPWQKMISKEDYRVMVNSSPLLFLLDKIEFSSSILLEQEENGDWVMPIAGEQVEAYRKCLYVARSEIGYNHSGGIPSITELLINLMECDDSQEFRSDRIKSTIEKWYEVKL
jgi:hypothetical protein